jgi:hypothetical protein
MTGMQSARTNAPETMAQFVARRNREVEDRERAYAEGNARWSASTLSGGNYRAPTTMGVVALGSAPVQQVAQQLPGQPSVGLAQRPFPTFAKLAAAAAGVHDCVSCHGRARPPFSGIPGFPFPSPSREAPITRDGPTDPPSRPRRETPKQCDIQFERDTDVCNRQPNSAAKAQCQSSAMERLQWCIRKKGEVGWPELFTHPSGPRR